VSTSALRPRTSAARYARRAIPISVLALCILTAASLASPTFRSVDNLGDLLLQTVPLALAGLGQTVAILVAGIDLSTGSVISLTTAIVSVTSGAGSLGIVAGLAAGLAAGAVVGTVNGIGAAWFRIPPLIMTLGTMAAAKGVALSIRPQPGGFVPPLLGSLAATKWGLLSAPVLLLAGAALSVGLALSHTRFGRYVYAIGGGEEGARAAGIPVAAVRTGAYALAGLLSATAGVVMSGRIMSGDALVGDPFTLDAIAAVVLGGTAIVGGRGGVIGTLAGAFVITLLSSILNFLNVFSYYQSVLKGLVLVAALLVYYRPRQIG
jgi:ribose/xylose/arabinose/galactoside ABC-type transport system permease subunit